MIKVINLAKHFKSGSGFVAAVDDVSFEVPSGQFVSITGRSGSGKSTLMYQMGALDRPTSGNVVIDGTDLNSLSDDERTRLRLTDLGYIFQDYANIPTLSSAENVMVPLLMTGIPEANARKQAERALVRVGLEHRYWSLPSQLSGGEQQRVSIARAISHEPKILFADEPTANLDSETGDKIIEAFLELNREGQTIVMVSHEPEVTALTHRVIELHDGRIVSDKMNK
jgi:putative ABC transport system ATP-binding protein